MSLPELVRRQVDRDVGRYCEARVPEHVRDKIRVEHTIRGDSVTVWETRPPWDGRGDWTRMKVAQFRYKEGRWTLYARDRNERWLLYPFLEPTPDLSSILQEVDQDRTCIFWG